MWNRATYSCKSGKYLASIIDNLVITCDKIIDAGMEAKWYKEAKRFEKETRTIPTDFNEKKATCKTQNL